MNMIVTLLAAVLTFSAHAQNSPTPELKEIEAELLVCDKAQSGPEYDQCLMERFERLSNPLRTLLNDECRWNIWARESDKICGEKAQYEGKGFFYGRRLRACMTTQYLMLYAELLNQKRGGQRDVDQKFLSEMYNDPDAPQIFELQKLRENILDKNSKEVKCEQKPMA